MKDTNLQTTLAGVKMRDPIGIGSVGAGPSFKAQLIAPEKEAETLLKHIEAGVGYVYLPYLAHVPEDVLADLKGRADSCGLFREIQPSHRFIRMEAKGHDLYGLYFVLSGVFSPEIVAAGFKQQGERTIQILKQRKPEGVPVIGRCFGMGVFPEVFLLTAKALEEAAVDLKEINLGCGIPVSMDSL